MSEPTLDEIREDVEYLRRLASLATDSSHTQTAIDRAAKDILSRLEAAEKLLDRDDLALAADACEYMADEYQTRVEHAHASGLEERADYWEPKVLKLRRTEERIRDALARYEGESDAE